MTTVDRRTFQRHTAEWLNRAAAGEEIVIESRGRPPLVLGPRPVAGTRQPKRSRQAELDEHFRWLNQQPPVDEGLLAEALRRDR